MEQPSPPHVGVPNCPKVTLAQRQISVRKWNRRRLKVEVSADNRISRATFELSRLATNDGDQPTRVREALGDLLRAKDGQWVRDVCVVSVGSAYVAEVTVTLADGASLKAQSEKCIVGPNSAARRAAVLASLVVIVAIVVAALTIFSEPGGPWNLDNGPLLGASAVLLAWLLAIGALGRFRRAMLVGEDNRVSTGKTAVFYWTAAVGFVMAYFIFLGIGGHTGCGPDADLSCTLPNLLAAEGLPTSYALLLGAPFAALLGAQALTGAKVESGAAQKTTSETTPSAGEAFQNDAGRADLVDSQYLLFTLIAALFFVVSFVTAPKEGLPVIPTALVALTGVSAATYVGKKAVDRNSLVITGIDPPAPVAGEKIAILGRNFLPDGAICVKVDLGGTPIVPLKVSNTRISLVIPEELDPNGLVLTVTTEANASATITLAGSKYLKAVVTPGQVPPGGKASVWLSRVPQPMVAKALPAEEERKMTAVVGSGEEVPLVQEELTGAYPWIVPLETPIGPGQIVSIRRAGRTVAQANIDVAAPALTLNPTRLAFDTPFTLNVPGHLQSEVLHLSFGAGEQIALPEPGLTRVVAGGVGQSRAVYLDFPAIATLIHDGIVVAQAPITLVPVPKVAEVSPPRAQRGDLITVTGGGLQSAGTPNVVVVVAGIAAVPILALADRIQARAADETPMAGDVKVFRSDTGTDITPRAGHEQVE